MTFEQNWNNLVARNEARKAGLLNKELKDKYPLTPNFTNWASANYDAISIKLQSPTALGTPETEFNEQDWTNFLLSASNKFLRKEKMFPLSEELAGFVNSQSSIDWLIDDIKDVLFTKRCVVCDDDLNRHEYHCDTCEAAITKSVHPNILEGMQKDLEKAMKRAEKAFFDYHDTAKEILQGHSTGTISLYSYLNGLENKTKGDLSKIEVQVINDLLIAVNEAQKTPLQKELERIDAFIKECNPMPTKWAEPKEPATDELGIPLGEEYTVEPEIIGDPDRENGLLRGTREIEENPHLIGEDQYGEEVYTDFSEDGLYLPQENPHNSSDTRDDADMTDHTEYRAQDWQSEDLMDDHNVVPYFAEQVVSEIPNIVETTYERENGEIAVYEHIEWETETHADAEAPVSAVDDEDWVEDARNWITREGMLAETEDELVIGEIMLAYPVSDKFLAYLEENEIDFELANSRLTEFVDNRSNIEWV